MNRTSLPVILALALSAVLVALASGSSAAAGVESAADAQGNLHVPADYRSKYEFLGTWVVGSDKGDGAAQMHAVFASPGTISAFRQTGAFPAGAILVKEVFNTATASMTTGAAVSRADSLKGWFIMVRDTGGGHAGHPLWADGWGWAWFDADNPRQTTSKSYKSDCEACHIPAAATARVYIQGYPPLK